MAITRRYQPSHPQGQSAVYGIDISPMLPPGTGITNLGCDIQTNTTPPTTDPAITVAAFGNHGRIAWVRVDGGTGGSDYLMSWFITDNAGNDWIISTLLLCAATS